MSRCSDIWTQSCQLEGNFALSFHRWEIEFVSVKRQGSQNNQSWLIADASEELINTSIYKNNGYFTWVWVSPDCCLSFPRVGGF